MSEPNQQTYTLATLQDFWALGDADRMERALKEISLGMVQAKRYEELLHATAEHLAEQDGHAISPDSYGFAWPDSVEWVDDGGKEITTSFINDEDESEFVTLKTTLGPGFHRSESVELDTEVECSTGNAG